MGKKQSRWEENIAARNPNKLAIVLFVEVVLNLSTGSDRDTTKNSLSIGEIIGYRADTIRGVLYNKGGAGLSAKAILLLLIELNKKMTASQRKKARALEWQIIFNRLQGDKSRKWMLFDIGRILSSKSVNLEREQIILPAKKGQLPEGVRLIREWTTGGVKLSIAE